MIYHEIKNGKGIATTTLEIPVNPKYEHLELDKYSYDQIIKKLQNKIPELKHYSLNFVAMEDNKYGVKITSYGSISLSVLQSKYNEDYYQDFRNKYMSLFSQEVDSILCRKYILQEVSKRGYGNYYYSNSEYKLDYPTEEVLQLKKTLLEKKNQVEMIKKEVQLIEKKIHETTKPLVLVEIKESVTYTQEEKEMILKELRLV